MSFFGKTKDGLRFVFVKIPAGVLGINTLRENNHTIRALYQSLRNPLCPKCSNGVLRVQDARDDDPPNMSYAWSCNQCSFSILGGKERESIIPSVTEIRQQESLTTFDGLGDEERAEIVRAHTKHARIMLCAAVVFFLGFCGMLLSGSGLLLSFNWLSLAACMFIFALKKSYRAWQVENGVLYVKGAFSSWFSNEQWFR